MAELETQLEISARLGYLLLESKETALNQTVSLGKQLYALRNALKNKRP